MLEYVLLESLLIRIYLRRSLVVASTMHIFPSDQKSSMTTIITLIIVIQLHHSLPGSIYLIDFENVIDDSHTQSNLYAFDLKASTFFY